MALTPDQQKEQYIHFLSNPKPDEYNQMLLQGEFINTDQIGTEGSEKNSDKSQQSLQKLFTFVDDGTKSQMNIYDEPQQDEEFE